MSFAVEDVFVSAIFSVACDVLANIGEDYKRPNADVRDLYSWANRFRAGVAESTDQRTGAARISITVRGQVDSDGDGCSVCAALCGGPPHERVRCSQDAGRPTICGHPDLRYAVIPADFACFAGLRPRHWRGPVAGADVAVLVGLCPQVGGTFGLAASRGVCDRPAMEHSRSTTSRSPVSRSAAAAIGRTAAAVLDWLG